MCDNGVTAMFSPVAELEKIQVKPDEVLVVKIDTDRYDISVASDIFQEIRKCIPQGKINVVGIPTGIELEPMVIQDLIKYLESLL